MTMCQDSFIVPVAPEGVPPTASELCAAAPGELTSGWSARIVLTDSTTSALSAQGRITLAPGLANTTVAVPEVVVVEGDESLGTVTLGAPVRQGNEFVFDVTFSQYPGARVGVERLVLAAHLDLDCAGTARRVIATTALYRCSAPDGSGAPAWISSGDACGECSVICEMAASPIVPEEQNSREPLGRAVRAQLARMGQVGNLVLLQAQHDGGAERFSYEWEVSAGRILWRERDLVLWEPPPGASEELLQVALIAEDAAAVASCRLRTLPLGQG